MRMPKPDREKTNKYSKRPKPQGKKDKASEAPLWLYGRHAAAAAMTNPQRRILRVMATKNAADWLSKATSIDITSLDLVRPEEIDKCLPAGAVHQGIALETHDLPRNRLKEVCSPCAAGRPVIVLDQITDPQNIGAIFRSAAAFGACAVIVQERRTPPLAGALAKAATGAIETTPCVKVVNIARAIEALTNEGYLCIGLAGEAECSLVDAPFDKPVAFVMGAEGTGLRPLVRETCDLLVRIPIGESMESLNVSNAAAISLYEATRQI